MSDISVIHGIYAPWDPVTISLTRFLQQQKASWGSEDYNVCEALVHGQHVIPYFDADKELDSEPESSEPSLSFDTCKTSLIKLFGGDPNFDFDFQVKVGYRHGFKSPNIYKLSWRFWVQGYSILVEDLPKLIRHFDDDHPWDLSVYSAKRKMAVPGGCKGGGDHRVLQLQDKAHPELAIIQNLTGNEIPLTNFPLDAVRVMSRQGKGTPPPEWEEVEAILEAHGFGNPVYLGRRESSLTFQCDCKGLDCPCCGLIHDSQNWMVFAEVDGTFRVKSYSKRCRQMIVGSPITDITPISANTPLEQVLSTCLNNMGFSAVTDIVPGQCFALQQHLETCPTCRQAHKHGSSYFVESFVDECYTVRNEETSCKSRIVSIETMVEKHEVLSRILQNPTLDSPLADLYVAEKGHDLTASATQVFRFQDNRWRELETPDLENDVRAFLERVIPGLMALLRHEEDMLQQLDASINTKPLQKLRNKFQKAVDVPRSQHKRKQIVGTIKTQLFNSALKGKWDARSDLLGLENGLIMLDTCTFRPALKEDYVTMSCGYPWLETVDPAVEAQVEEFISQVYPIVEEREFMQRYSGYCLTGDHREKIFLILNDLRGGYNGKSTFLSLLIATLGDYAIKADPCVLYKQDRTRGINDHSGGLLAFEKKRLMVVEETSSGAILDEEKLKEWHGSRARVSGRQLHSTEMREFEWITKLILAANEGKIPHFSCSDVALTERIATVPHRSRFQETPLPDEPYTYAVDTHIKDKFPLWRPYMLRWCLEGLKRYHVIGFRQMPPGCLAFKQSIMDDKDVVKEWLDMAIEQGDSADFVKLCDLYSEFTAANRSFQADKRTKKSAKMFERELHRCLGMQHFKAKHQFRVQGKNVMVGKVFMSYRKAANATL